ncbi:MAG: hypothetical protein R6U68_07685 [Desulfobacteraceae bacterium]
MSEKPTCEELEHRNKAVRNQYSNKALETGLSTPSMDVEITCKDETTRNVLISLQPGDNQHLTTFVDITEQKRAEAEKEKLQAQLLQAQKMESVGRLAGGHIALRCQGISPQTFWFL